MQTSLTVLKVTIFEQPDHSPDAPRFVVFGYFSKDHPTVISTHDTRESAEEFTRHFDCEIGEETSDVLLRRRRNNSQLN